MLLEQVADRARDARRSRRAASSRCAAASISRAASSSAASSTIPMRAVLIFSRKLGEALARAGDLTDADGVLREALDLAGPAGPDRARVLGALAFVAHERDRSKRGDRLPARGARAREAARGERPRRLARADAPRLGDGVSERGLSTETSVGVRRARASPRSSRGGISTRRTCARTSTRCAISCAPRSSGPDQKRTVPGAAALLRELGRAGRRDPHPLGQPRAAALAPRGEAPARRRALGVAHAQAEPAEHPPPALPRAARPARLQAAGAAPAPLRARAASATPRRRARARGPARRRRRGRRVRLLALRRRLRGHGRATATLVEIMRARRRLRGHDRRRDPLRRVRREGRPSSSAS